MRDKAVAEMEEERQREVSGVRECRTSARREDRLAQGTGGWG